MSDNYPVDIERRRPSTLQDCPDLSALSNRVEINERRHSILEQRTDAKLSELIEFTREVVKLQERNNRNSDDIAFLREQILNNSKIANDRIIRLHSRLDDEVKTDNQLRSDIEKHSTEGSQRSRDEIKKIKEVLEAKTNSTKEEVDKYRNIFIGVSACGILIFGMMQYIANSTLDDIRSSLAKNAASNKELMVSITSLNQRVTESDQQTEIIMRKISELKEPKK